MTIQVNRFSPNVDDLIVADITFDLIDQTNFTGGNTIQLFICDEDGNLII